ncbi:hypothetical protein GCM10010210_45580 [Pseudonocardia hydrocarbonoxydans]|uniref:Uncharacterized protein n=1 Tax=Pseudonocardia hydrocarbonoxydans TaxID=76726 RepID=A0A4Y3WUN2_9PSEU|nr:hypothetical protein PHY01_48780 [Pseudonocardia hydrocarbonoxydans]
MNRLQNELHAIRSLMIVFASGSCTRRIAARTSRSAPAGVCGDGRVGAQVGGEAVRQAGRHSLVIGADLGGSRDVNPQCFERRSASSRILARAVRSSGSDRMQ